MTFDLNTVKIVSVIAIGVLILLAILMSVVIRAIVGKLIAVALLVGLAIAVYVQRDQLMQCAQECACSFFGVDVELPEQDLIRCGVADA